MTGNKPTGNQSCSMEQEKKEYTPFEKIDTIIQNFSLPKDFKDQ
jgi:hypothetical protein